jgi:hypothetical protein
MLFTSFSAKYFRKIVQIGNQRWPTSKLFYVDWKSKMANIYTFLCWLRIQDGQHLHIFVLIENPRWPTSLLPKIINLIWTSTVHQPILCYFIEYILHFSCGSTRGVWQHKILCARVLPVQWNVILWYRSWYGKLQITTAIKVLKYCLSDERYNVFIESVMSYNFHK